MKIHFNNSPLRSEQGIYVEFENYDSNIYLGGHVEIAPPFGAKVTKTLTSESVYKFTSEDKSLLSNINNVQKDCDLEPTETIYKGDFKLGSYVVNIKNKEGLISSFSFLIREPSINIDYKVNISNSTCELYDKTNYKLNNVYPTTKSYSLIFTAPSVMCHETNTMGKTYIAPESWDSGSLIYINNRASKSVATSEDDRFIVTPIYDTTYYIRYESEFTYSFSASEITSTDDARATSTYKNFSEGDASVTYDTGKVTTGNTVSVQSPTVLSCDIWERIKDLDIKYKQALCKNTILADKLKNILDRALQLYALSKKATDIGNTDLALMYLNQMADITKTRLM